MVDYNSFSANQRFALNLLVPFLYCLPVIVAWFSPKNFGFGYFQLVGVSLAVGIAGLMLWMLSTFHLGKSLAVLPGADSLVARGVYRYIRHPIYVGITFTLLGLLFACGSVFGMVYLVIVVIPLNVYRARQEERVLAEKFGEHYLQYRNKTWF
jgi:protein-S-isoprenylcysteine O-methyltransferase Ste14